MPVFKYGVSIHTAGHMHSIGESVHTAGLGMIFYLTSCGQSMTRLMPPVILVL